mgnify:CR=1 FL=1
MPSNLPVCLYIPNILGYTRIGLAFGGLYLSDTRPEKSVIVWILSATLDLFDGLLARALNQTSSLGILIDIAADNILRSCCWLAASTASSGQPLIKLVAVAIISLEWITMFCTQMHAIQSDTHWKTERQNDPWLVRTVFANNFRTPIGVWVIYGLFSSSLFAYGSNHPVLYENVPMFTVLQYAAYCGRLIGMSVELWMCKGYISLVISKSAPSQQASKTK